MPFIINAVRGVPKQAEALVRRMAAKLNKQLEVAKPVPVVLLCQERIEGAYDEFGNFWCCEGDGTCRIELAGLASLADLRKTFAHEVAHYEQFSAGHEVQERGVEVRARTLLKLAGK